MNCQTTHNLTQPSTYGHISALSLQKIFDASPDVICTIDAQGRFVTINQTAYALWQYYPYQLAGTHYMDMVVVEDRTQTTLAARALMQGVKLYHFENRFYRKDGTIITLSWSANWCAEEQLFYCTARDISQSMILGQQIKQREKRFRSLIEHGSDITGIIDLAGNYTYISDNAKAILGYQTDDFIGKNIFDFIHPDDAAAITEQLIKIATEKYIAVKPFRFKNAAGEWRYIETKATNLSDDPDIGGIVINSRDVTERKAIEDRLHMLSLIVQHTKNSVVITDAQQRIIWVNKAFEDITEYTLEEVVGKRPFDFFKIEANEQTLRQIQVAYETKTPVNAIFANYSKSGNKYWVESQMQTVLDEGGKVLQLFGLQYNITERKRLEEQLQKETEQRQKRITAAIIHTQEKERAVLSQELHDNINQVLTTVKLYNEMSLQCETNRQQLIEKSIQHLIYCINEIRSVSKTLSSYTLKDMGLNDSLEEMINAINLTGKVNIQFKWQGINKNNLPEEMQVAVFRIIQEQLANILKHAAAQSVKVAITTGEKQLTLRITDDGKGFDTAQKTNGTGITNMRYRIEALNGQLEIISAPKRGCTLMAVLPLNG